MVLAKREGSIDLYLPVQIRSGRGKSKSVVASLVDGNSIDYVNIGSHRKKGIASVTGF